MSHHRKPIATGIMIAVFATGLAPAADAWAADSELQELRHEVSRLRAETQSLQDALAQTTELERQRSVNLIRAMKVDSPPPPPSAPPPAPPAPASDATEAREPAGPAAPSVGGEKRRSKSRHRRHRSGRARSKASRLKADATDR